MNKAQNPGKIIAVVGALLLLLLAIVIVVLVRAGNSDDTPVGQTTAPAAATKSPGESLPAPQRAIYTIEYNASWSASSHPETLPPGPHVSPIVVVAHANDNDLFAAGTTATDGIEIMAETGATTQLALELGDKASILNSVTGGRIDVPGSNTLELEFDQEHSLLSAVSMLAPSPDWFVAVNSVALFEDGNWLERVELTMKPYDAGTDSGATFTAPDSDTVPAATIGPPADEAFIAAAAEGDFATIIISRQN